MAAHENLNDFDLFPEHGSYPAYFAHEHPRHDGFNLDSVRPFSMAPELAPPYGQDALSTYDGYAALPAYSHVPAHGFYDASHGLADNPTGALKHADLASVPRASPTASVEHAPSSLSTASGPSVASAASSAIGSPHANVGQLSTAGTWADGVEAWVDPNPSVVAVDASTQDHQTPIGLDSDLLFLNDKLSAGFVDPALIQSFQPYVGAPTPNAALLNEAGAFAAPHMAFVQPPSPAPSHGSMGSRRAGSINFKRGSESPYLRTAAFQPYRTYSDPRRPSLSSVHSSFSSHGSPRSTSGELDDEGKEKGRCPNPDCGKVFKDLKAHMLTHQSERPEKCPIVTCEYHQKGFARKYDKNRHTLTHYKGTMVCGFCPGSGSAAEKSFNRADVFKRHLTAVHGVEQTPPNSRKKLSTGGSSGPGFAGYAKDATGKCSTCSGTFSNAQDFYEHLDDCVLRVVQQEEPSEAINEIHLSSTLDDEATKKTLRAHSLPSNSLYPSPHLAPSSDNEQDGLGRKNRKEFPLSWGCAPEQMKMRKRVLCVFDGPRRLWKDDMMLNNEFEVRLHLGDGKSYVTDLDVQTLKRAHAFHNATEEEKGPWILDSEDDDRSSVDLQELMS
ncbi:MAG: hypothetical protein M1838_004043 [Thelocarpon superellum]|nr:MAG: hypothetical protein M1838_004043 [Thelocarpon superellum]